MGHEEDQFNEFFILKNSIATTSSYFPFLIDNDKGFMVFVEEDFYDVLLGHGSKLFEDNFLEGKKKFEGILLSIVEEVHLVVFGSGLLHTNLIK